MLSLQIIPILLSISVGALIAIIVWSFLRDRNRSTGSLWITAHSDILLLLLVLAGFILGVFVTFVLFSL